MLLHLFFLMAAAISVSGEEENMRNLTTVSWAHAVNNKTYLDTVLTSDISMLEADVVVGHVRGKESGQLEPIMAHPPATTSDLTLHDFLTAVSQHNRGNTKQKGVKLDFKSIEAFEKAQELISKFSAKANFPIWLNADILPGPVAATTKPVDPDRFLKLGAQHPRAVLSLGWTTRFGGNITEGEYSRDNIGTMLRIINEHHINQTVTFAVRAGIASKSQPVLLDLLRETASLNCSMTVWSSDGDAVEEDRLRALILTVGLERTYLDVPPELANRLHLPPADKTRRH